MTSLTSTANGLPKSLGSTAVDIDIGASGGRPPPARGPTAGGRTRRAGRGRAGGGSGGQGSSAARGPRSMSGRPDRRGGRGGVRARSRAQAAGSAGRRSTPAGGLRRVVRSPLVAHHLLLDLVDLGLDAARCGRGCRRRQAHFGVVQARRTAQRRQLFGRQAFAAHLAQHVEFALAHEVVAPLALDHGLELGLLELQLARVFLARVQLVQSVAGLATKRTTLRKKLSFLGHVGMVLGSEPVLRGSVAGSSAGGVQSPNIFCLSSRRCWASSDSVAVGRASKRARPMGSPVSSQ
jgi:hypothetical protein